MVCASAYSVMRANPELKPLTLLERRRNRMKTRPCIDFNLIKTDTAADFQDRHCVQQGFEVHEQLGQGTVGVVCRATRRSDDREVALKIMRIDDEELLAVARQEFELLRSIEHPNIIEALDFFVYPAGAVMTLAYFAGRTLGEQVLAQVSGHLAEATSQQLFKALMLAVDHLHRKGIIHRDIKASNILISNDLCDLKLVDFNTAQRTLEGGALTMTGTVDYLPPEVILGDALTEKSDVWSSGLCLHLMLTGELPVTRRLFPSRNDFAEALSSQKVLTSIQSWSKSPACKHVARSCLEPSPSLRASAADVLRSRWLS